MIDNQFDDNFDHAIYCGGMYSTIIANNTAYNAVGDTIKISGQQIIVSNNTLYNAQHGGIFMINPSNCIVANNTIKGFGQVAISLFPQSHQQGDCTNNIVEGNVMYAIENYSDLYEGIRIWARDGRVSDTKVNNNTIVGAGQYQGVDFAAISVGLYGGLPSDNISITGNIIDNCEGGGISLKNISNSILTDNIINIPASKSAIIEVDVIQPNYIADNLITTY